LDWNHVQDVNCNILKHAPTGGTKVSQYHPYIWVWSFTLSCL